MPEPLRRVTVYSLGQSEETVAGDYLTLEEAGLLPALTALGEYGVDFSAVSVKHLRVKVEHLVHLDALGNEHREYLAIHPRLRSKLEMPIRAEYDEAVRSLNKQVSSLRVDLGLQQVDLDIERRDGRRLRETISAFCAAPWYARVWRALKGDLHA